MKRDTALALLGGTVAQAAQALNISHQAIYKWPTDKPLPRSTADRVLATRVRLNAEALRKESPLDPITDDAVTL